MLGAGIATQIRCLVASKNMRRLEDGPVGGSPLYFGDDRVGYALDAPLPPAGEFSRHSARDIAAVAATLNRRPRKTLSWRTPSEVFNELLLSHQ